uniref:Uncharacterized protein n=1 Tax=Cucumis melo TaxID=3656 RepID=A0A9I9EDC4_CUCME
MNTKQTEADRRDDVEQVRAFHISTRQTEDWGRRRNLGKLN